MVAGEPGSERFGADWLTLREPADAEARATGLLDPLRSYLGATTPPLELLDLGSGTGATARWLAPKLDGPQRWVLLDHDADLLRVAIERCSGLRDAAGGLVEVETRTADLADLRAAELAGTQLVTASALLDLLAPAEVDALADLCATTRCAALFTLSVAGRVVLDPPDPLDAAVAAAFDAHQRRTTRNEALLGPDAVNAATQAFQRRGYTVHVAASPWRLGPESAPLVRAWLDGWLSAAQEQRPALTAELAGYRGRRGDDIATGRLRVEVDHGDLLALPGA